MEARSRPWTARSLHVNVSNLLRDLRDGLSLTVYSSGDDFFVNVSEWRLSHDALDRQRETVVKDRPREQVQ